MVARINTTHQKFDSPAPSFISGLPFCLRASQCFAHHSFHPPYLSRSAMLLTNILLSAGKAILSHLNGLLTIIELGFITALLVYLRTRFSLPKWRNTIFATGDLAMSWLLSSGNTDRIITQSAAPPQSPRTQHQVIGDVFCRTVMQNADVCAIDCACRHKIVPRPTMLASYCTAARTSSLLYPVSTPTNLAAEHPETLD